MRKEIDQEFLEDFKLWMTTNKMDFSIDDDNIVTLPEFGKLYLFDGSETDKLFKGEDELTLQLPVVDDELIDDDIFYVILKWGNNFYYTDLRGEVDLQILKYLGECSVAETLPYVNLGVHTPFELLNGSFLPDLWAKKAKFYGHSSLGICDHNTLAGTLNLQKACKKADIKHIFGYSLEVRIPAQPKLSHSEFMDKFDCHGDPMSEVNYDQYCSEVGDGIEEMKFGGKVYCLTNDGWANMLRIQKYIMVDHYEDPHISLNELLIRGSGNCFVFDKFSSETITPEVVDQVMNAYDQTYYQWDMSEYKADRFDSMVLDAGLKYLDNFYEQLPPILISDNYYLDASDSKNKAILNKIAHGTAHQQSDDQYFKTVDEQIATFDKMFSGICSTPDGQDWYDEFLQEITSNTIKVSEAAEAEIETGVVFMPEYEMKPEEIEKYGTKRNMFHELIEEGLRDIVPKEKWGEYRKRVDDEVYVIESSNNIDYFIIFWDIINRAKLESIQTGVARGSAGGSLVAYLMYITTIDPMKYDLIFERFLTPERCGLLPQDVTVLGDQVDLKAGEEYVEIEFEGGTAKFFLDSELIVKRGDKEIECFADQLKEGDEIVFDKRDEIWELPNILK